MIIFDIGHTYIKSFNSQTNLYEKINVDDTSLLKEFLYHHQNEKFYIGIVNLTFKPQLELLLQSFKIDYHFITHQDFKDKVKVSHQINFEEVGLDILSIIYYVDDNDYIFVNNGTALLYLKYSHQLDGVIISNNILFNTEQLMQKTNLYSEYQDILDFGLNTSDAIAAGITFSFKQTLKTLIEKYQIKKIYVNGIQEQYLKGLEDKQIKVYDNPTLNGYIKLLKTLNCL